MKIKVNYIYTLLAIIIILAFILRIYSLGNPVLWFDETISAITAESILHHGIPIYDSGLVIKSTLLFHYSLAFFTFILGNTDFAVRFASVLFGLCTVLLAFFIGREFSQNEKQGNFIGLASALLTAVFYLEVLYSRQARFYQLFQLLFFLTLFFLYKSKNNNKYSWFTCISLIFLLDTQIEGLLVLGLMFVFFFLDKKPWKFYIIPVLALIWYGKSLFYLPLGDSSLASTYLETYSSSLLYRLRAFFFISLLGIPLAYKANKRLSLIIIVPTILTLLGLLFIKVFAIRYAYFSILLVLILISVLLGFLYKHNKILAILVLLLLVLYPSNLFFSSGNLTIIKPESLQTLSNTEPVLDYKSLSDSTKQDIIDSPLVVLSSPGVEWYLKKPDYVISFSLNGLDSGFEVYNEKDVYTGAELFNLKNPQISQLILIEDAFGYAKLSSESREYLDSLKESCSLVEESSNVKVYSCNLQ